MKVKLKIPVVGADGGHVPGDVIELCGKSANNYVALGWAERVEPEVAAEAKVAVAAEAPVEVATIDVAAEQAVATPTIKRKRTK